MTAKEYLRQLKQLEIKIAQRRLERDRLMSDAMGNGSPRLTLDRVQTSISGDTMGDKLAEATDIQKDIEILFQQLDSFTAKADRDYSDCAEIEREHVTYLDDRTEIFPSHLMTYSTLLTTSFHHSLKLTISQLYQAISRRL